MTLQVPEQYRDTSAWSYHVDESYYTELERVATLLGADWPAPGPDEIAAAQAFLNREARLLDGRRFSEWLELFAEDGIYWVPVVPDATNPIGAVSFAFDDCRRLTDRVYWLDTGMVYSQSPPSRTRRIVSGVDVTTDAVTGNRLIRCNFAIHESRLTTSHIYAGWVGYVVLPDEKIKLKQVNLLDSDQVHDILTLIL
jgi:3-phenylpropionate/cinnamic acid dioxygenase small subunit